VFGIDSLLLASLFDASAAAPTEHENISCDIRRGMDAGPLGSARTVGGGMLGHWGKGRLGGPRRAQQMLVTYVYLLSGRVAWTLKIVP
jgi:hypothetical protein